MKQKIYNAFWFNRWLTRVTVRFLKMRMELTEQEDWILYAKLHDWQNVHDYQAPSAMSRPLTSEEVQ